MGMEPANAALLHLQTIYFGFSELVNICLKVHKLLVHINYFKNIEFKIKGKY